MPGPGCSHHHGSNGACTMPSPQGLGLDGRERPVAGAAREEAPCRQRLSRLLQQWCRQERVGLVGAAGRHGPTRHGYGGQHAIERRRPG